MISWQSNARRTPPPFPFPLPPFGALTIVRVLEVRDGLVVVGDALDPLLGLDVPLGDVAVVVAGDELVIERVPDGGGHLKKRVGVKLQFHTSKKSIKIL